MINESQNAPFVARSLLLTGRIPASRRASLVAPGGQQGDDPLARRIERLVMRLRVASGESVAVLRGVAVSLTVVPWGLW